MARLSGLRSELPTGASYDEYARLIVADLKTNQGVKKIPTSPNQTKVQTKVTDVKIHVSGGLKTAQ